MHLWSFIDEWSHIWVYEAIKKCYLTTAVSRHIVNIIISLYQLMTFATSSVTYSGHFHANKNRWKTVIWMSLSYSDGEINVIATLHILESKSLLCWITFSPTVELRNTWFLQTIQAVLHLWPRKLTVQCTEILLWHTLSVKYIVYMNMWRYKILKVKLKV